MYDEGNENNGTMSFAETFTRPGAVPHHAVLWEIMVFASAKRKGAPEEEDTWRVGRASACALAARRLINRF